MNTLSQLSRRYLRRQWKRTLFTSLGIVMATALFAGLALLLTSFVNMYIESETASDGAWHYHVSGLSLNQAEQLRANIRVKDSELLANSKYLAKLTNPRLEEDPSADAMNAENQGNWLLLRDISQLSVDLTPYPMTLLSGRMPENSTEIALNTSSIFYFPDIKPGQTIDLELFENGSSTSEPLTRTYTVTGITDWSDTQLPGPAYYALTHVDAAEQSLADLYLTVKPAADYEASLFSALSDVLPQSVLDPADANYPAMINRIKYVQYSGDTIWDDLSTVRLQIHDSLLRFLGQSSYGTTNQELFTFFAILALIIMVSVIFVIRNSFAMSVSERTSEYGLLRVVGGSPSQIRRLVIQDAVQMAVFSIPLGLLAGVVAMKITLNYVSGLDLPEIKYLKLIVSPWPLILAAALSILAIILAALSPAIRAGRLSPMEAVRKSGVYSVKRHAGRGLKRKGRLSRRLTGVTGFLAGRSIRRDRKRFMVTTLSVMISAVLFLAAGGISFMFSKQLTHFNTDQVDFRLRSFHKVDEENNHELTVLYNRLAEEEAVSRAVHYHQTNQPFTADPGIFSDEIIEVVRKSTTINGQPASEAEALNMLTSNISYVRVILADRELLDHLPLSNRDQIWADMQAGQVVLSQTNPVNVADLSFQTVPVTKLTAGDSLTIGNEMYLNQETGELLDTPEAYMTFKIAAEIDQLPWFSEGFFSGFNSIILFADKDMFLNQLQQASLNADSNSLTHEINLEQVAAFDALDGQESIVETILQPTIDKYSTVSAHSGVGDDHRVIVDNNYEQLRTSRNIIKGMNVFVYGFATVIILICSMNILNTVTTNVLLRRRELAMLQAVGMSRAQVRKMLLMESSLYGLTGAIWGSAIGTVLLYLLGASISGTMGGLTLSSIPWNLVLFTLIGALIISVSAGILPIRRVMKDQVVEAIRAQE